MWKISAKNSEAAKYESKTNCQLQTLRKQDLSGFLTKIADLTKVNFPMREIVYF